MHQKNKAGFTLTELMAVVIIVAVLAGIAFGSYKKAVERSRFAEGQVAGATVAEAVSRYYYDNLDTSYASTMPQASYLDVGFANDRSCTLNPSSKYCFRTQYFEVLIQSDRVKVSRVQGNKAKDYYFYYYPEFLGQKAEECGSLTQAGADLCKSMGYTACSGSGASVLCSKP